MNLDGNSNNESADRWLFGSTHVWNDAARELTEYESRQPFGADEWCVIVQWRVVGGRALPVGLEVSSSLWGGGKGDQWPADDVPKEVTRDLFKRLPVGQIIRAARQQVAEAWEWMHDDVAPSPEVERVAHALTQSGKSSSRSDWKYRETAKAYAAALDDPKTDRSRIAVATQMRLQKSGDPELMPTGEATVRKWIAEARRRGYLPRVESRKPGDRPTRSREGRDR